LNKIYRYQPINAFQLVKQILPLSLAYLLTYSLGHISLGKVPLSFHHAIKGTSPIFIVFLSRIFLNESYPIDTYLSLIPIMIGVSLATYGELSFDSTGFITGFLSTFISVCQTIYSKFLFQNLLLDFWNVQFYISSLSAIILFPFCFIWEFLPYMNEMTSRQPFDWHCTLYLILSSMAYYIHNVLAFTLVARVATLTYAIAGVTKRIFLIAGSVFFFGNPISPFNGLGIILTITGVALYQTSRYLIKKKSYKKDSVITA